MSALQTPAPDAPASEWGRLAVSIPDLRWLPGMLDTDGDRWGGVTLHDGAREVLRAVTAPQQYAYEWRDRWPDPDDPATAGCFLALLGKRLHIEHGTYLARVVVLQEPAVNGLYPQGEQRTLGRACIAAAAALGRWPGGGA